MSNIIDKRDLFGKKTAENAKKRRQKETAEDLIKLLNSLGIVTATMKEVERNIQIITVETNKFKKQMANSSEFHIEVKQRIAAIEAKGLKYYETEFKVRSGKERRSDPKDITGKRKSEDRRKV